MCIILIDADAFLFARSLGLLELLEATHEVWPKPTLRCTATIARNELNTVQELVQKLEALGLLRVEHILARTPAARLKREIQDKCRVHKGEAEAIAWACSVGSDRPVVSSLTISAPNGRRHSRAWWLGTCSISASTGSRVGISVRHSSRVVRGLGSRSLCIGPAEHL